MRQGSRLAHCFRLCCLAFALLTLAASGCAKKIGSVSGKVTYQGKALPAGYVNFLSGEKGDVVKTSTIGADGTYSVSGVPVGSAKITVQGVLAPVQPPNAPKGVEVLRSDRQTVYVPPKYSTVEQSGLTYDVKPGSQEHPIDLK